MNTKLKLLIFVGFFCASFIEAIPFSLAQDSPLQCIEETQNFFYQTTSDNRNEALRRAENLCENSTAPQLLSCVKQLSEYYYKNTSDNRDTSVIHAMNYCQKYTERTTIKNRDSCRVIRDAQYLARKEGLDDDTLTILEARYCGNRSNTL